MRPKVIFFHLSICPHCRAFYEQILEPLYKNNDIDLVMVDVEIDSEVRMVRHKNLLEENPFTGYKFEYDYVCRRSEEGCVVPAVKIEFPDGRKPVFLFTNGNKKEFEKAFLDEIEKYIFARARLVYG